MKDYCLVKIDNPNISFFLEYAIKEKINLYEINYFKNYIYVKCLLTDYEKIKKSKRYKVKIIKRFGLQKIFYNLKRNHILIFSFIIGYILLLVISNIILEIKILHNDSALRSLLTKELADYGLTKYSFKKKYEELDKIKKNVLLKYKERLEWIEIENIGMKYIVRLEERIINSKVVDNSKCHIVSTKDALVLNIKSQKGQRLVNIYDYVKKGDILISGNIIYNNEIKNSVCASGSVWGEVWYNVNVSLPLNYYETKYTNKKRYNLRYKTSLKDDVVFLTRFKTYETKSKKLFNILGFELFFNTEYETKLIGHKYTTEEALKVALLEVDKKVLTKIKKEDKIIAKKVLKKELNDSTMNIEVFVVVKENIGLSQKYE